MAQTPEAPVIPSTHLAASVPSATAALELNEIPTPTPGPNEVLIESHAFAIQPLDAKMHNAAYAGAGGIKSYPATLGTNVAGIVVKVGEAAQEAGKVKVGDRVVADTAAYTLGDWRMGGWQQFVVCGVETVSEIGDAPFDRAVLLGFPLQTAVASMKEYLGMGLPGTGSPTDKVLIWGGGGAVGSCAIQYAKSVGHTVIATASPRDVTHLISIGANAVIDYHSPTIVEDIRSHGPFKFILNAVGNPESHMAIAALIYPPGGSYASVLPAQNLPENVKAIYTSFSMSVQKDEHKEFRDWWYGEYFTKVLAEGKIEPPRSVKREGGLKVLQQASRDVFEGKVKEKVVIDPTES